MTMQSGDFEQGVTVATKSACGPQLGHTYWGYVVTKGKQAQGLLQTFESIRKLMGLGCVLAAIALWTLPGSINGADVAVMKLGVTVALLLCGAVLIWSANAGYNDEVQVDLQRNELRLGMRNNTGGFHVNALVRFDQIGSVFVVRAKKPGKPAHLFVRIGDTDQALKLIEGDAAHLEPLKARLESDIENASRGVPLHDRGRQHEAREQLRSMQKQRALV